MASIDEQILRAAKEITVKFIEMGRLSPNAFPDTFREIYQAVDQTVRGLPTGNAPEQEKPEKS
jgi:hypothetical protein